MTRDNFDTSSSLQRETYELLMTPIQFPLVNKATEPRSYDRLCKHLRQR